MTEVGLKKSDLDTPALWVDLDLLEQNIASLSRFFQEAGVNWRPHTKGIKIPAIAHKAIQAGAIGVTCAKLSEAEVMAAAGITNILIANEVVGAKKLTRLAHLQRHAEVKPCVDSEANLVEMGQIAAACGVEIGVLVDVDTGMHRAGATPGEATVKLASLAHRTPGLRFMGLMAWEGHTVAIEDPQTKRQKIEAAIGLLAQTADLCRAADLPVEIISGGGSGSYTMSAFVPGLTEIQAGGAMFCDATYLKWGAGTTPSLFVQTMVVSRPAPDRIIFDAGFKALPAWDGRMPQPVNLPGFQSYRTSAEHGAVLLDSPDEAIQVGDLFDFIVGYGDSTVFLHDNLYGVRNGVVEVVWPIQGRGKIQ